MALLPKYAQREKQLFLFTIGFILTVFTVWYLLGTIDLIPDKQGPVGYLDDAILLLAAVIIMIRLVSRVGERYKGSKKGFMEWFSKHSIFELFFKPQFWILAALIAADVWYLFWIGDIIPDKTVAVGYLDDIVVVFASFRALWRLFGPEKKR